MDQKLYQELDQKGYIILKNILSSEECVNYKRILEQCVKKYSDKYITLKQRSSHGLDNKDREKVVYNLHNKDIVFAKFLDHPDVFPYIQYALQQGSYGNAEPIIHTLSTARSPKKGDGQQLHIDSRYPGAPFALTVTVIYCLEDFTKENGATRIIPGSHLRTIYPENGKQYSDEVLATVPAGSVIVFNGGAWHGSSHKETDQDRWGAIFSYARWFVKPSFDLTHNMPLDIYNQLTERQKELLGFKFNPPKDEFTRISGRAQDFEEPAEWYSLPK